jgi:NAD(P)-dependent dehydrogenase (short-subunit alcohol dehydrogenase family)
MKQVIVVTGASSGFGALAARALADAGHTVYAGMRETGGRNAAAVKAVEEYATERKADLRAIELDVASQESADSAIEKIVAQSGRLDVVVHNAGHMVFGPAEAFTPEQFAELYDINVLSTQRVNRSALPQLRKQGRGLLVWVSSSSSAGGTPPYLAPYFAAKAGMDALAVQYARELALWGILERRPTRSAPARTRQGLIKDTKRKSRRPLPPSFRRMPMWAQLQKQS